MEGELIYLSGTDHPFSPPLEEDVEEWHSVNAN
jgi:aminocarboxymuconate-semialdehyde decarboxylase